MGKRREGKDKNIFDKFFQIWTPCDRIKYVDSFKTGLSEFGDRLKYKVDTR